MSGVDRPHRVTGSDGTSVAPMTARHRTACVLVVFALIVSACGGDAAEPSGTTIDASTTTTASAGSTTTAPEDRGYAPNPASIDLSLESNAAVISPIGPDGGSVMTTDGAGNSYTLTIPQGALFSEQEIAMTPIGAATGEVIGDTFLAGVELEPSGLTFLTPATLEVSGPGIAADTVGFSSESGGGDIHLVVAEAGGGSISFPLTHFSDFGAAAQELLDLVEAVAPTGHQARFVHSLMRWQDAETAEHEARGAATYDALDAWIEYLIDNQPDQEDVAGFETWTAAIVPLVHSIPVLELFSHNTDLLKARRDDALERSTHLYESWIEAAESLVNDLFDQCVAGDVQASLGIFRLTRIATQMYSAPLNLFPSMSLLGWVEGFAECWRVSLTWQADVITSGTGANASFVSEISVGAEARPEPGEFATDLLSDEIDEQLQIFDTTVPLEVEYIAGFWEDTCVGMPGSANLTLDVHVGLPNLGIPGASSIDGFTARVRIVEDVFIACSAAGFTADGQYPFHGGALELLNEPHLVAGEWEFALTPDPGGGVVAQFIESGLIFPFPDGEYEMAQLLTLYQLTSPG